MNLHKLTAPVRKGTATRKQLCDIRDKLIKIQLATGTNCSGYLRLIAERIRLLEFRALSQRSSYAKD